MRQHQAEHLQQMVFLQTEAQGNYSKQLRIILLMKRISTETILRL